MFQALNFLHQISDGSLDNVSFPMENADGIKEEPHEYDLPERDYDCSNFVETEMSSQDPDAKPGFYKFGSYKKIKKSKMKNDGSEGGAPGKPYECNICGKAYKGLDTIQDFLCELGMKSCMHLVEISIFSQIPVIVRPTKNIKDLFKDSI